MLHKLLRLGFANDRVWTGYFVRANLARVQVYLALLDYTQGVQFEDVRANALQTTQDGENDVTSITCSESSTCCFF